ncbi:MAG: hypothetical protein M4579_003111 [Chaenotheca gracillima]|nr:MAG: hypothetical protein M4579_003111 [Chaenotheca gracillima]
MFLSGPRARMRSLACVSLVVAIVLTFVLMIVFGMRSDYDEMHPFVAELLPAGHCLCHASSNFECGSCLEQDRCAVSSNATNFAPADDEWVYTYGRDDGDESLTPDQCGAAFPGLFEDVDRAVDRRSNDPITSQELANLKMYKGMVRAMIYEGELYVIAVRCMGEDHRQKVIGTLQSIHRAISVIPRRREMPNIEFAFTIEDMADDPSVPIWALTKRSKDESVWLMPDFGFWSWNREGIGPYSQIASDIIEREQIEPWEKKEKRLVWRGKLSFAPKLRRALLNVAKNKSWSDVRALRWWSTESMENDFVSSVDQCKYMFIAHAEGRSYSAGLKYKQTCHSVIVAHKLQWFQNFHYLMVSKGPQQNFVEVERDFSDLPDVMEDLLRNPEKARKIADNNVKTFRERYLTPAAQSCYWRALFHGWAKVSFRPELYEQTKDGQKQRRGVRFERFVLFESKDHLSYP